MASLIAWQEFNCRGSPRDGFRHPHGANINYRTDTLAYTNACRAAEVEVDIDAGEIKILSYIALLDSGVSINPTMVDDQVHGGVAHGIGNALFGWMGYDAGAQPIRQTSPTTFCRRRPKCL